MRIRLAVPRDITPEEKAGALDAALEAVTRSSEPLIARGVVPTAEDAIRRGLARWKPEPPGDEHFDVPTTVLGRGWGDCDDLAPWHAASLRVTGQDPHAEAVVVPSAPGRWHAVVRRGNGEFDDPSIAAGMGSVSGPMEDYFGPFWPLMNPGQLAIAMHPLARGMPNPYAARVDIPDLQNPWSWSGVHAGATPPEAVRGACQGALLGAQQGYTGSDDIAVVGAVHDLLCGMHPDDVAACLEGVGFLNLLPAALPMAGGILSSLTGGGGGGAPPGPAAAPGGGGGGGHPGGGGGGPGYGYGPAYGYGPQQGAPGPIIIRF